MSSGHRETAVIQSALWAAAGDALGWITELANANTVRSRTGGRSVDRPVPWKRRVGGRGGVIVHLPAGIYSDDTQLRLAVCRSIRGNGSFDPETFARIELTVWPSYALGAGLGSKAAAANLSKRGVNWFSNFFETKDQSYFRGGGNGASMRIQPHVWARPQGDERFLLEILRNAIITHGHPHGFCGALFHGLSLADALECRAIPPPAAWRAYLRSLESVPDVAQADRQLAAFWLPAWSESQTNSLGASVTSFIQEAEQDIERIMPMLDEGPRVFNSILETLGCFEDHYRGSGWKTALAATALAWICRDEPPEQALILAANALGSDTDTIGTMAGALMGAAAPYLPSWRIQDSEYIRSEAIRLAKIASGQPQDSFAYPDPARWHPPSSQADAVVLHGDELALAGLGPAFPFDEQEYRSGSYVWQWLRLSFGQTILAKRRAKMTKQAKLAHLPSDRRPVAKAVASELPLETARPRQFYGGGETSVVQRSRQMVGSAARPAVENGLVKRERAQSVGLDALTDHVIQSNFDDRVLGRMLNRCIDELGSIEGAAAFAGIIAKAKLARRRRHG